jgi:hypothetical protein
MNMKVEYLNNFVDRSLVQKLFVRFANKYGNLWTSRLGENGDWKGCEDDWLGELSAFSVKDAVTAIKKALVIYKDYPPTQGQIIDLCLKESGVPSEDEIINLMVAREFTHPVVKLVYDRIGSWNLTNGTSESIRLKTKAAYGECVGEFRLNQGPLWETLKLTNNQLALASPEPSKIPTQEELKGFKERMAEYQQKLEDAKINLKGKTYKEFDENKIKIGHKDFDQSIYNEYRDYLLSIPENETMILPIHYLYQRMRFIGAKEQEESLKKQGYVPPKEREGVESPKSSDRRNSGPTKIYKSWNSD